MQEFYKTLLKIFGQGEVNLFQRQSVKELPQNYLTRDGWTKVFFSYELFDFSCLNRRQKDLPEICYLYTFLFSVVTVASTVTFCIISC